MPDRAVAGFPDCEFGEFLVRGLQLLQADDVRQSFAEPAHQHRKTTIDAVHVEGRYLHLFPLPISGRQNCRTVREAPDGRCISTFGEDSATGESPGAICERGSRCRVKSSAPPLAADCSWPRPPRCSNCDRSAGSCWKISPGVHDAPVRTHGSWPTDRSPSRTLGPV